MKKTAILVFLAILTAFIYSCHKDTKVVPADFILSAIKDSSAWGATAIVRNKPGDSLEILGIRPSSNEQLNVSIKFNGVENHTITNDEFFKTTNSGAIITHYRLDPTRPSTLEILSFNKQTNIISGTFTLHFLKDDIDPKVNVPLNFTNGTFRIQLPE